MKKIIFIPALLLFSLVLSGCSQGTSAGDGKEADNKAETEVAEKLEVYYFHRTARCYSCNALGEYTAKTLLERFSEQMADGTIVYGELNVDLPENKEIARKFKASGSSLYINRIIDGQDNIEHDVRVWQLIGNEKAFQDYLGGKLTNYLGL
jgi:predicted small secreted protein